MNSSWCRTAIAAAMVFAWVGVLAYGQDAADEELGELTLYDLGGDRITLNAERADIRALLGLLSQARRLSIIAGPEVEGTISVNLFDTPFDEACSSILGIAGFTHFRRGTTVFITTESAKQKMPIGVSDLETRVYDVNHADLESLLSTVNQFLSPSGTAVVNVRRGTAAGGVGGATAPGGAAAAAAAAAGGGIKGKLIVLDAPEYLERVDELIASLDVPPFNAKVFRIDHAMPEEVLTAVRGLLSPNGKAMLGSEDRIVVQDAPEYLTAIEELIEGLDAPPRQVLISARLLSITHDNDLRVGVGLQSTSTPIGDAHPLAPPFVPGIGENLSGVITGPDGIYSVILMRREQAYLDALSIKGKVETVAAPQILTVDGEEARILVGASLGYQDTTEVTQTGGSLQRVAFLDVGTELKITPRITQDDLVRLQVAPKVSTGEVVSGLPQETTTEAETVMMVRDGETVLIGGLLRFTRQRIRRQVPVLGDIPVLGLLLGHNTWKDGKSELLILITPYIVGPQATPEMHEHQQKVDNYGERLSKGRSDLRKILGDIPVPEPGQTLEDKPFKWRRAE